MGGATRKDVAGYDLKSLLIGSEGTLGIVTAAWLRLIPAPEAAVPVAGWYPDVATGCAALERVLGNGLQVAALEYLDERTIELAAGAYPGAVPAGAGFMVLAEADGTESEAAVMADALADVLAEDALAVTRFGSAGRDRRALALARRGLDRGHCTHGRKAFGRRGGTTRPARRGGHRHDRDRRAPRTGRVQLGSCRRRQSALELSARPQRQRRGQAGAPACDELFELAVGLGGTISGEHGVGWVKRGHLGLQWNAAALGLHHRVKQAFDPKNLMNPGKKT